MLFQALTSAASGALPRGASIILAVLAFSAIIVVHELGHFLAARKAGVFVEEFAIGMGPVLFSTKKKHLDGDGNELPQEKTVFSVRMFPIGGFCKMLGEDEDNSDSRAFNNKKVSARMMVILGGVAFNLLLAFVLFVGLTSTSVFRLPEIDSIVGDSGAASAGLLSGDKIISANDSKIRSYYDLALIMQYCDGRDIDLEILRGGQKFSVTLTPLKAEDDRYIIGFIPKLRAGFFADNKLPVEGTGEFLTIERAGFFETVSVSLQTVAFNVRLQIVGLVRLVTAKSSMQELSGPIGITKDISDEIVSTFEFGFSAVVRQIFGLVALLSAALGVFNLLPLPGLDGGRFVFLAIEGLRRKPISPEKEGMVHFVGLVLLIILAIFIAYSDVRKII